MHKRLLFLYGKINIWLFYALVIVNVLLLGFFQVDKFFPRFYEPCQRSSPFANSGAIGGAAVTILLLAMAGISLAYVIFGSIGFLSTFGSKPDLKKRTRFRHFIMQGIIGFITAFLIFFLLQVILGFAGITSCGLQLPEIPES